MPKLKWRFSDWLAPSKGTTSDDKAALLLKPLRSELRRIEAELANAEAHTNVIELHPQAVQRFKEDIEGLASILAEPEPSPDLTLIASFRSLVEAVVVEPRVAGQEYEVRIRGRSMGLMGSEVSAIQMVAGDRFERSPSPRKAPFSRLFGEGRPNL
jgi:site-specific DNA recombinase